MANQELWEKEKFISKLLFIGLSNFEASNKAKKRLRRSIRDQVKKSVKLLNNQGKSSQEIEQMITEELKIKHNNLGSKVALQALNNKKKNAEHVLAKKRKQENKEGPPCKIAKVDDIAEEIKKPEKPSTEISATSQNKELQVSHPGKKKRRKFKRKNKTPCLKIFDLENIGKKAFPHNYLNISHVRDLLHFTLLPQLPLKPTKWCSTVHWSKVQRAVLILVGYVNAQDYNNNKDIFTNINKHFDKSLPVRNEGSDSLVIQPTESLLYHKMNSKLMQKKILEANLSKCTAADYVLTAEEKLANEFPFPYGLPDDNEEGYVTTREGNKPYTANKDCPLLAMDCEMCETMGGRALTRVSVVNEELEVIYNSYVKPDEPVTNYLTQCSGISEASLRNVTTTLKNVQTILLNLILEDRILVGHSLDFDLRALKLHHDNIIDTTVIYEDTRGPRFKPSLKSLACDYLKRSIQTGNSGHCSIEDAKASMELVKLKIQQGQMFGTRASSTESIFESIGRHDRRGVIIDNTIVVRQHCFGNVHGIPCSTDEEVVQKTKAYLNKGDFIYCHLKGYENLLKEEGQEGSIEAQQKSKETLKQIDSYIGEIISEIPPKTLVIVSFGGGFVPPHIQRLQKDKEQRKSDAVKNAVKAARDGLCFVKITNGPTRASHSAHFDNACSNINADSTDNTCSNDNADSDDNSNSDDGVEQD